MPICTCLCRRPPGQFAGRLVAIDARVQRRPPRALVKEEDAAVEQAAELVLNDSQVLPTASSHCILIWFYSGYWHKARPLGASLHVVPRCAGTRAF